MFGEKKITERESNITDHDERLAINERLQYTFDEFIEYEEKSN